MANTFKLIQLIGISSKSYEDAVSNAIKEASRTIHDMSWFEVVEQRGRIENDAVVEYQIKINVAFKLVR